MVTKITSPVTPLEVIGKVNEIIDDFTLDNLTNVSISSPSAGQNLTYDATNQVWKNTSSSATVAWGGITGTLSDQTDLNNALNGKVPTYRTINSKALTSDITLTASDVGALPNTTPIPTKTSDLTNDSGYITGITSSDVTSALGYTPYNSSNPSGYTSNVGTVTSVNNTSPDANGNVSLSIPTVNNAILTLTQGGTTKGTFTANASSNVTIDLDSGGGSVDGARKIGQIVQSTIPLSDAGLHLLDGSLISGSGSYADFVTYISNLDLSADYFCTEAEWQTSVTNYGVCDKFVYDSVNNTVRLPKRTSEHGELIKSYSSGTDWYRIYSDGWCEQGGYLNAVTIAAGYASTQSITFLKTMKDTNYNVSFGCLSGRFPSCMLKNRTVNGGDAEQFNRAGSGSASTQHSWRVSGYIDISDYQYSPIYEYLVIATSTKTDIEVDIDEIATDLNGKADVDLSNCTKPHIVETYVNGTSWYRVYSDGWCEQGGYIVGAVNTATTVNLLKSMPNTEYVLVIGGTNNTNSRSSGNPSYRGIYLQTGVIESKAIDSFVLGNGENITWQACGYIS